MQRILSKAAAGLVLTIMAGAMIYVGVAFVAYAITLGLAPSIGMAGGAAVAGGILLIGPLFWVLVTLLSKPPAPKAEPNSAMGFLSALARDKPLVAVAAAILVGAADMLLKRRNRS